MERIGGRQIKTIERKGHKEKEGKREESEWSDRQEESCLRDREDRRERRDMKIMSCIMGRSIVVSLSKIPEEPKEMQDKKKGESSLLQTPTVWMRSTPIFFSYFPWYIHQFDYSSWQTRVWLLLLRSVFVYTRSLFS